MCIGGGGGGGAARAAEQAERDRQRQVASGNAAIDQAFQQRAPQYDDFLRAMQQFYRTDLDRQQQTANRQSKFGLARGGLIGGSAQGDVGGILGREYDQGLLQGERMAQSALGDLQGRDEQTRMSLMGLVQGGADTTTIAQNMANSMRANISGAKASNMVTGLGDVFGGTADLYRRQQEAAQRRRGLSEAEKYANPFSRSA